jgi:ribonuclease-3 family protein
MEEDIMEPNYNVFRNVNRELSGEDIMMLSPLQLAYIGDSVYELLVRTYLVTKGISVKDLHKATTNYVKAKAQAKFVHELEEKLTEKEKLIIKKGRNAKSNTSPKNTDIIDYKYATGFECLFGYLYLMNQDERIKELFEEIKNIDIE